MTGEPKFPEHKPAVRLEDLERLVARAGFYNGVFCVTFVVLTLFAYGTFEHFTGEVWFSLRKILMWTLPLYLFLCVTGVLVGFYTLYAATKRDIKRRGITTIVLCVGSIVLLLLGKALLGG